MSNHSVWAIDKTLSGATTQEQSIYESNINEEIHCVPQISWIIQATPSYRLVPYPEHSLEES